MAEAASLDPATVTPRLRGRFGRPYVYRVRCESTQRLLGDAPEGAVAVAEEQTEGRGRLGRSWVAPPRTAVLVSIVLRPPPPLSTWPELTLVAAGAVVGALESVTGLRPTIKHPNDVLLSGQKVAGILAEASDERVVAGIGINVNLTRADLPQDVRFPATSLLLEQGAPVDRVEVLVALLERLEAAYETWRRLRRR